MDIEHIVLPALVLMTSLGAVVLGTWRLGLAPRRLGGAALRAVETIGLLVAFGVANVALGIAGVLAYRGLTGEFMSFYVLNDAILGLLSLLQALVFQWWRAGRRD
ncbi:MAG TPA: hypothetical protein VJU81_04945 [Methylomirabilota bacterium]|nr:hypothetical protein [Methylomirabilota bacterium]